MTAFFLLVINFLCAPNNRNQSQFFPIVFLLLLFYSEMISIHIGTNLLVFQILYHKP